MGIFSRFNKKTTFNLKKPDFKVEDDSFYDSDESGPLNEEIAKHAAEWRKEQDIPEDREFSYDRSVAIIHLFGNEVEIIYWPGQIELNENDFIDKINQKLNWISKNQNELNSRVVRILLPLKNESWLEENESRINEKTFMNRIKLISIIFFDDLSSELVYDDGNLFWSHQIVADLSEENELTNADIQG